MTAGDRMVNEKELSKISSIAVGTLQDWRKKDMGPPYHKVGRSVLYSLKDFGEWLKSKRHVSGEARREAR